MKKLVVLTPNPTGRTLIRGLEETVFNEHLAKNPHLREKILLKTITKNNAEEAILSLKKEKNEIIFISLPNQALDSLRGIEYILQKNKIPFYFLESFESESSLARFKKAKVEITKIPFKSPDDLKNLFTEIATTETKSKEKVLVSA